LLKTLAIQHTPAHHHHHHHQFTIVFIYIKSQTIKHKHSISIKMKNNSEVPIFLRKTYHMIDTCDPTIASWSEDGETFIVKQPDTFSSKIIPQFFKHSKFSSFVRQLNFYGFRKIKFSDSIKIDEQLERETKDYWRFRHECFRQGREDLLTGIKRSNSNQNEKATKVVGKKEGSVEKVNESKKEVNELKMELSTLKDRIAKMTDNIDTLTNLVQNVTLEEKKGQAVDTCTTSACAPSVSVGTKRKKVDYPSPHDMEMDAVMSSGTVTCTGVGGLPLADSETNDISNIAFTPGNIFPSGPLMRANSESSNVSDVAFVDELFNALDDSDMNMDILPDPVTSDVVPEVVESSDCSTGDLSIAPPDTTSICTLMPVKLESDVTRTGTITSTNMNTACQQNPNAPDPKLMNKLSDALTVLPKDMQELLVNRLIATITSSEALKAHLDSISEGSSSDTNTTATVATETKLQNQTILPSGPAIENNPEVALPLAAATLAALMTQFSAAMKNKSCVASSKSLPVIPIHA